MGLGVDESLFRHGPAPIRGVLGWLQPRGGPLADGLRLALVNGVCLVLVLLGLGFLALVSRVAGWLYPFPRLFPALVLVGVTAVLAAVVWYRFGRAYRNAARMRNLGTQADVFGAVAAVPFIVFGLVLVASGLLGVFAAAITLSPGAIWSAFTRIGYGLLFGVIAIASVVVARIAAADDDG
jgi:hypothetical protein